MTDVSLDTKRYLDKIGSRIRAYHNAMTRAKEYVLENHITGQSTIMNCIIISLLWVSAVREEELSEEELLTFLGFEPEYAEDKIVSINQEMAEWSLEQVLDYVVENF